MTLRCRVLLLAAALGTWVSPVVANCPFQMPLLQGGSAGTPAGFIRSIGPDVNGAFWELGYGDPADGAGNDCNSLICGFPAFTQPDPLLRWIKLSASSTRYKVDYNFFNAGTDGCISGGGAAIVSTVMVYYIVDTSGAYAIAALQGSPSPVPVSNLDLLVTGDGPNGNDVPLRSVGVTPRLANVQITDDYAIEADVLPAATGVNIYYDAGGPYAGVLDVSGLSLDQAPGCDPVTGCHATLSREQGACWEGEVHVIAHQELQPSFCQGGLLDGYECDPDDPAAACLSFDGVCPPEEPLVVPFGPPIPGSCLFVGGPLVDDSATAWATRSRGFTVFRWEASELAVSHYNILDVTREERRINPFPIGRRSDNDGTLVSYEFVATGAQVRGGRVFELEMVRTDGQSIRFPVD